MNFFKLVFKEKIIKFDKNFDELRFYNVVVLFIHSLSKAVGNWILHLVQSNHTRECFNQFHIVYRQKLSEIIGNSSDMLTWLVPFCWEHPLLAYDTDSLPFYRL